LAPSCYDPAAMEAAKAQLPDVIYCGSAYDAAEGAEAVVIATELEQFRALDLDRLRSVMARPVIVDLRNIYRAEEMKRANFRYLAVGRPMAERHVESPLPPRPQSRGERRASRRQSPRPRGLKRDSWKLNHKRVVRHPKVRAKRASKAAWPRPSPFEGIIPMTLHRTCGNP
jgi:hypothetical protein